MALHLLYHRLRLLFLFELSGCFYQHSPVCLQQHLLLKTNVAKCNKHILFTSTYTRLKTLIF